LTHTLTSFVLSLLKLPNLSGLDANMKTIVQEKMKNTVPCLFIVSIGFDPSKEIQEYATKTVGKERFEELSMGGDQN
jgi:dynein heavy chain 2